MLNGLVASPKRNRINRLARMPSVISMEPQSGSSKNNVMALKLGLQRKESWQPGTFLDHLEKAKVPESVQKALDAISMITTQIEDYEAKVKAIEQKDRETAAKVRTDLDERIQQIGVQIFQTSDATEAASRKTEEALQREEKLLEEAAVVVLGTVESLTQFNETVPARRNQLVQVKNEFKRMLIQQHEATKEALGRAKVIFKEMDELKLAHAHVVTQLSTEKSKGEEMEAKMKKLSRAVVEAETRMREEMLHIQRQCEDYKREAELADKKMKHQEEAHSKMMGDYQTALKEKERLIVQVNRLTEDLATEKKMEMKLREKLDAEGNIRDLFEQQKAKMEEMKKLEDSLRIEIRAGKVEIDGLQTECENKTREMEMLKESFAEQRIDMESAIDAREEAMTKMRESLEMMQDQMAKQADALQNESNHRDKENKANIQTIKDLKAANKTITDKLAETTKRLVESEEKLKSLKASSAQQINTLKQQSKDQQQQLKSVNSKGQMKGQMMNGNGDIVAMPGMLKKQGSTASLRRTDSSKSLATEFLKEIPKKNNKKKENDDGIQEHGDDAVDGMEEEEDTPTPWNEDNDMAIMDEDMVSPRRQIYLDEAVAGSIPSTADAASMSSVPGLRSALLMSANSKLNMGLYDVQGADDSERSSWQEGTNEAWASSSGNLLAAAADSEVEEEVGNMSLRSTLSIKQKSFHQKPVLARKMSKTELLRLKKKQEVLDMLMHQEEEEMGSETEDKDGSGSESVNTPTTNLNSNRSFPSVRSVKKQHPSSLQQQMSRRNLSNKVQDDGYASDSTVGSSKGEKAKQKIIVNAQQSKKPKKPKKPKSRSFSDSFYDSCDEDEDGEDGEDNDEDITSVFSSDNEDQGFFPLPKQAKAELFQGKLKKYERQAKRAQEERNKLEKQLQLIKETLYFAKRKMLEAGIASFEPKVHHRDMAIQCGDIPPPALAPLRTKTILATMGTTGSPTQVVTNLRLHKVRTADSPSFHFSNSVNNSNNSSPTTFQRLTPLSKSPTLVLTGIKQADQCSTVQLTLGEIRIIREG